jgi:hypothetical protein
MLVAGVGITTPGVKYLRKAVILKDKINGCKAVTIDFAVHL